MTESIPAYFMDDPREATRLADKVNSHQWVEQYLSQYISKTLAVLEVGCGPGMLVAELAGRYSELEIIGMDASPDRIAHAERQLVGLKNATAILGKAESLAFESSRFDLTYCRFLFQYLPNPLLALQEMVRVTRPGGRVFLQDLDGQLLWHYPPDEAFQSSLEKVVDALATSGFDPFVGRKLFHLAYTAGLEEIQVQVEPYHLYAGKIDEHNYRLWELKLDIAIPAAAKALGRQEAAQKLKAQFLEYLLREDSLTYSTIFTVTGIKPT